MLMDLPLLAAGEGRKCSDMICIQLAANPHFPEGLNVTDQLLGPRR